MGRLYLRPKARNDLRRIRRLIRKDKPTAADRFINKIRDQLAYIADNPMHGSSRDYVLPNLRCTPIGKAVAYYFPMADGVDVVRIGYLGQNIDIEALR